jgi:hypothetical protein
MSTSGLWGLFMLLCCAVMPLVREKAFLGVRALACRFKLFFALSTTPLSAQKESTMIYALSCAAESRKPNHPYLLPDGDACAICERTLHNMDTMVGV